MLEKDHWVGMSMFNAWQESKERCYKWLEWQRVHQTSLCYRALWQEEQAVAGRDFYPWGFQRNRAEVDKILQYSFRRGLTPAKPEDLFHPSALST